MKTLEQLKNEFQDLKTSYEKNPLPAGKEYNKFAKKWKSLQSKIKSFYSVSNQIKRAGIKVSKSGGGYIFTGNSGLIAEVFLDGCETDYWTVYFIKGTEDQENEIREHLYSFERKSDAMYSLLILDINS